MMCHLANVQYVTGPADGNTGQVFVLFGGPVYIDWISNCPLDKLLIYENSIYLLNFQICVSTTSAGNRSEL